MTPNNLTDQEMELLESVTTEQGWNDACDAVKRARGGIYPQDWYHRVIATGMIARVAARFGRDDKIHLFVAM